MQYDAELHYPMGYIQLSHITLRSRTGTAMAIPHSTGSTCRLICESMPPFNPPVVSLQSASRQPEHRSWAFLKRDCWWYASYSKHMLQHFQWEIDVEFPFNGLINQLIFTAPLELINRKFVSHSIIAWVTFISLSLIYQCRVKVNLLNTTGFNLNRRVVQMLNNLSLTFIDYTEKLFTVQIATWNTRTTWFT